MRKMLASIIMITFLFSVSPAGAQNESKEAFNARMSVITKALASDKRSQSFVQYDTLRKPLDVMRFAGIKQGMSVLLVNADAYYIEIVAGIVGSTGTVYIQGCKKPCADIESEYTQSEQEHRNVTFIDTQSEMIALPAKTIDMAFSILAYHTYFKEDSSANQHDILAINQSLYRSLKPGGAFIVVDHMAEKGSSEKDFAKLARVDLQYVGKQLLDAGFKFAGMNRALHDKTDDKTKASYLKIPEYTTARFIMRFVKK